MDNVVRFADFKFDSLRKYMVSFYGSLQHHVEMPEPEKVNFVTKVAFPEFYKRLRLYREKSVQDVATACKFKVTADELLSFENGALRVSPLIEVSYCDACSGHFEREYFFHQLRAFFKPSIKDTEIALAKEVFIKTGLKSAYVDYKNLGGERGKVLTLSGHVNKAKLQS